MKVADEALAQCRSVLIAPTTPDFGLRHFPHSLWSQETFISFIAHCAHFALSACINGGNHRANSEGPPISSSHLLRQVSHVLNPSNWGACRPYSHPLRRFPPTESGAPARDTTRLHDSKNILERLERKARWLLCKRTALTPKSLQ
jgi:hypothetical protein